jgi:hypothetical protein
VVLPLSLFRVENRICLSHGVQVIGAAWQAATRIVVGVRALAQRTEEGQAQVGYSVAGRLRGWVTLCMVCTMHVEMRSAGFLVEPQNQGRWFVSCLARKPLGRFVSGLVSKPLGHLLVVWHENHWDGFSWFGLKTGATVSPDLA